MEDLIKEFMGQKRFAVVGATDNPAKYGNKILKNLKDRGYEVYPVNPKLDEIEDSGATNGSATSRCRSTLWILWSLLRQPRRSSRSARSWDWSVSGCSPARRVRLPLTSAARTG